MLPGAKTQFGTTCAVVVNWNGWQDTIVCLESLLAQGGTPMHVVVCDNASADDSMGELERFLLRRLPDWLAATEEPAFINPRCVGGVHSVHLLRLPRNLGYAGAINAGIEWARNRWELRAFWLLNNDVHAEPGALDALVSAHASVTGAGLCGSVLLDWDEPARVQAVAGIFRRWLGVGWHFRRLPAADTAVWLELDYPIGASMYVSVDYLDKVGLMDPAYFLYYEEMDWAERGRRLGYRPLVALESRLRHKEGASTGSRGGVRNKSLVSEGFGVVNRLRITRKFWPHYLPVVWLSLLLVMLERLVHGETERAWLVMRLMLAPSRWLREAQGQTQALSAKHVRSGARKRP